ncbi:MAG TPA: hypothetical protein VHN82_02215 [Methanoregula sp.]|nr:hypothetical protein [Methanoregula sp.]
MKWQSVAMIISLLIATVLIAGCTEEEILPPRDSIPSDPVLPGQQLVLAGDVTGAGLERGAIDTVDIPVALAPGVKPVDIEKTIIIFADTIKTETLIPVEGYWGDPPQGSWGIVGATNQVGSQNNRLEDKEQIVIRINPRSYIPAKRMIIVVIRSPPGTNPLTIRRVAPSTVTAQGNIFTSPGTVS